MSFCTAEIKEGTKCLSIIGMCFDAFATPRNCLLFQPPIKGGLLLGHLGIN
jgi:hypothetical protein